MNKVPFSKYTVQGNSFIILDELNGPWLSENQQSQFARQVTSKPFGVGADYVLVIAPYKGNGTVSIDPTPHRYRESPWGAKQPDFIISVFSPSGDEVYCSINGLLCVSEHLHRHYGLTASQVITGISGPEPFVVAIGMEPANAQAWVVMPDPHYPSTITGTWDGEQMCSPGIKLVNSLTVGFRSHDLAPFTDQTSLNLSGYLTFAGEPHLVIVPKTHFSLPEIAEKIFIASGGSEKAERRSNFGSWLIHKIGCCLDDLAERPSVDFLDYDHNNHRLLRYRCFDRHLNRETQASGNGALASAFVFSHLMGKSQDPIRTVCWGVDNDDPEASPMVSQEPGGWRVTAKPSMLLHGDFKIPWCMDQNDGVFDSMKQKVNQL